MEIRDILHGTIQVRRTELPILDSRFFQRLRHIKQLGFSEQSFPSANHNRYIHSLGAMETATRVFSAIFSKSDFADFDKFESLVRLAALLHDVGHGPLSHTTEAAMPPVSELKIPFFSTSKERQATHEDYTLKIILDSELTPLLEKAGARFGFGPKEIASLIEPKIEFDPSVFQSELDNSPINLHPILRQMISSELDVDRMDYLRRDSLYAGVSYGKFDADWLISNLTWHKVDGKAYLALQHRALYAFEDFLLSRFHMFLMVYFHYKGVIFDEMLSQYLESSECDYRLPSKIEDYIACNDSHLYAHLAKSQNPWAQRIVDRKSYRLLYELHSGIPATEEALNQQLKLFENLEKLLKLRGIHYLVALSTGELSKYFKKPGDPIFVRYDNHFTHSRFISIEKCTDLFERYKEKRFIKRLYVSEKDYPFCREVGKSNGLELDLDFAESSLPN